MMHGFAHGKMAALREPGKILSVNRFALNDFHLHPLNLLQFVAKPLASFSPLSKKVRIKSSCGEGVCGKKYRKLLVCSLLSLIACNDINDPVIAVRVALEWKTSS